MQALLGQASPPPPTPAWQGRFGQAASQPGCAPEWRQRATAGKRQSQEPTPSKPMVKLFWDKLPDKQVRLGISVNMNSCVLCQ